MPAILECIFFDIDRYWGMVLGGSRHILCHGSLLFRPIQQKPWFEAGWVLQTVMGILVCANKTRPYIILYINKFWSLYYIYRHCYLSPCTLIVTALCRVIFWHGANQKNLCKLAFSVLHGISTMVGLGPFWTFLPGTLEIPGRPGHTRAGQLKQVIHQRLKEIHVSQALLSYFVVGIGSW